MALGEKALKRRVYNLFFKLLLSKARRMSHACEFFMNSGLQPGFFVALRSDAGVIGRQYGISLELSPAAFAFDTFDEALYAARPASR